MQAALLACLLLSVPVPQFFCFAECHYGCLPFQREHSTSFPHPCCYLCSYELGSAEIRVAPSQAGGAEAATAGIASSGTEQGVAGASAQAAVAELAARVELLEAELLKVPVRACRTRI